VLPWSPWRWRLAISVDVPEGIHQARARGAAQALSGSVIGRGSQIATLQQGSPDWIKARQEFLRLYYGPLAIVESFDHATDSRERLTVEHAMIIFKSCLDDEKQCNELGANLYDLSLALAHSCRESLGRSWGYEVKQLDGDYHELALAHQQRLLAKRSHPKIAKEAPAATVLNEPKKIGLEGLQP